MNRLLLLGVSIVAVAFILQVVDDANDIKVPYDELSQ